MNIFDTRLFEGVVAECYEIREIYVFVVEKRMHEGVNANKFNILRDSEIDAILELSEEGAVAYASQALW